MKLLALIVLSTVLISCSSYKQLEPERNMQVFNQVLGACSPNEKSIMTTQIRRNSYDVTIVCTVTPQDKK